MALPVEVMKKLVWLGSRGNVAKAGSSACIFVNVVTLLAR
jgi:hypothetical protein